MDPVPSAPVPPPAPPSPVLAPPSGSDKIWSLVSHLSAFLGVGFFIVPLVVYLAMRHESSYAAENAREALNFHISYFIYALCCTPLAFLGLGVILWAALFLGLVIFSIIAAIKASEGGIYRYPLSLRLVK
jgi:uncharacterized protein